MWYETVWSIFGNRHIEQWKCFSEFNFLSNTKTTYSQIKNICHHFVTLKLFHMHSLNLFTTTMIMTLVIHRCFKKHLKGHEIVKFSTAKCNIQSLSVKSICSFSVSMSIKYYIFLNNNSNMCLCIILLLCHDTYRVNQKRTEQLDIWNAFVCNHSSCKWVTN